MKKFMKKLAKVLAVVVVALSATMVVLTSTETGNMLLDFAVMQVENPDVNFDDTSESYCLEVVKTADWNIKNNLGVYTNDNNVYRLFTRESECAFKACSQDNYSWSIPGEDRYIIVVRNIDDYSYVYNRTSFHWFCYIWKMEMEDSS